MNKKYYNKKYLQHNIIKLEKYCYSAKDIKIKMLKNNYRASLFELEKISIGFSKFKIK